MKIEPFKGTEQITIGQTEEEVISALGQPGGTESETYEDDTVEKSLTYPNLGLELTFSSEDDYRLTAITFENPQTELFGVKLIGLSESDFQQKVKEIGIIDIETDSEYDDIHAKDYASDKYGLSFWCQDGQLESITLFPKFNSCSEIEWPE
jgi:hypothetical protein